MLFSTAFQIVLIYSIGFVLGYLLMFSRAIDLVKSAHFLITVYGSVAVVLLVGVTEGCAYVFLNSFYDIPLYGCYGFAAQVGMATASIYALYEYIG